MFMGQIKNFPGKPAQQTKRSGGSGKGADYSSVAALVNSNNGEMFSYSKRPVPPASAQGNTGIIEAAVRKTRQTGEIAVKHLQAKANSLNDLMADLISEQSLFAVKVEG